MKSSIKVAYASKWANGLGQPEPIIRIEVSQDPDDPRDALLQCIFTPTAKIEVSRKEFIENGTSQAVSSPDVYIISVKNRFSQVCDLLSTVFSAIALTTMNPENLIMCTGDNEIYFEKVNGTDKKKRSKGLYRDRINDLPDYEIIKLAVADFKEFTKR